MKTSLRFEGGDRLAATLRELPTRVSKSVLREALKTAAAPPIQQTAASLVARAPGAPDIAARMVVSNSRAEAGPSAAVLVGPSAEVRTDKQRRRPISFGLQGMYLEFGTARQQMQPFLRPAFDQNVLKAIGAMSSALWHALISRGASGTRGKSTGGGLL